MQSKADKCVFLLYKDKKLVGIVGVHVDDLPLAGESEPLEAAWKKLTAKLPFGDRRNGEFMFTGIRFRQAADGEVTVDQELYCATIQEMPIKSLKFEGTKLTAQHQSEYRGVIGQLGWAASQTRPDIAFGVSYLQGTITTAEHSDVMILNKLVRTVHEKNVVMRFQPIVLNTMRHVMIGDAGWASRKDGSWQAGWLHLMVEEKVLHGERGKAVIIDWYSRKITRKVRSSYAAETMALQYSRTTALYRIQFQ